MLSDDQIRAVDHAIRDALPFIPDIFHGSRADVRPTVAQVVYDFGEGVSITICWSIGSLDCPFVRAQIDGDSPYQAQYPKVSQDITLTLERAWADLLTTLQDRASDCRTIANDHEAKAQEYECLARYLQGKDSTPTLWERLEAE